jgi:hypothetical protein
MPARERRDEAVFLYHQSLLHVNGANILGAGHVMQKLPESYSNLKQLD